MTIMDASVGEVFGHALTGEPCHLVIPGRGPIRLPIDDWTREADADDHRILDLCVGATLDVGCGPGRLTGELAARGQVALGIDVVREAVGQAQGRGGVALHRDVFDPLPGEGRWATALLADGNIGIGGRPGELLRRVRALLAPNGRVVVELAPSGVRSQTFHGRLECKCARSEPFAWSVVGADDADVVAADAGLTLATVVRHGDRWCAVLES